MSITAICSGESPESPLGFEACGFCESQLRAMVLGQLEFIETEILVRSSNSGQQR